MTEWATMQTALVIPPESCHSRVFSTDRCLFVVLRPFDRRTCRPSCLSRMRRDSLHERMLHGSREDYTDKIWQALKVVSSVVAKSLLLWRPGSPMRVCLNGFRPLEGRAHPYCGGGSLGRSRGFPADEPRVARQNARSVASKWGSLHSQIRMTSVV